MPGRKAIDGPGPRPETPTDASRMNALPPSPPSARSRPQPRRHPETAGPREARVRALEGQKEIRDAHTEASNDKRRRAATIDKARRAARGDAFAALMDASSELVRTAMRPRSTTMARGCGS